MTRTLSRLALAALLCACAGDKSDDTATPSTGTGAATGTGTGNLTAPEDCDDGVDNDFDGLQDCEDDDCATDPACGELDCANGLDDDGDGRIDCVDEDCWGHGCEVTVASLAGFDSAHVQSRYESHSFSGGAACGPDYRDLTAEIALVNPRGTVRHMAADATAWTTCSWAADNSAIQVSSYSFIYNGVPQPVSRTGFTIDSGCAIQTSGFLPQLWTPNVNPANNFLEFDTRPTGNGPPWWRLDLSGSYTANYGYGSSSIPGSPCNEHVSYSSQNGTWFGGVLGSDYTAVNP